MPGIGMGIGLWRSGGSPVTPLSIFGSSPLYVNADLGVTKNGSDLVSGFADQSGNARHFTQTTDTIKPLYEATGINGKPSLYFNGDYMVTPAFTVAQPCSIFAIIQQVSWVAGRYLWDASPINRLLAYQNTTTPNIRLYSGAVGPQLAGPAVGVAGYFEATFDGASSAIRVNGGAATTGNASTLGTTGGFALGDYYGGLGAGAPANFRLRALFVTPGAITAEQRAAMNAWCARML